MKPIPVRMQKIIAFIPFVNQAVFFAWLYNYFVTRRPWLHFAKAGLSLFCYAVPVLSVLGLAYNYIPEMDKLLIFLGEYIILLLWDFALIRLQE